VSEKDSDPSTNPAPAPPEPPEPPDAVAAPPPPPPVVVPQWIQLVGLPLLIVALWLVARAAGPVLLVFLVAGVIALILAPLVRLLQRAHLPRALAVIAVYPGFLVLLVGAALLLVNPINEQLVSFEGEVPALTREANQSLGELQDWLDDNGIDIKVQEPGSSAAATLERRVLRSSGRVVDFSREVLQRVVEAGFALILVLVISIYMLLYADRIGNRVRQVMPPGDGTPEDDYPRRVQHAVGTYVRGQLLFSLIMGASAGGLLWLLGATDILPGAERYALMFGFYYGIVELLPYVGAVLGLIPPALAALVTDPLSAVWVLLAFLALQQLESHLVAPQVYGRSLRINPLLVIFALLFGAEVYGVIGALLALPVAAILRETILYLRRHLVLEPWTEPATAPAVAPSAPAAPGPEGRQ
jgi:putative heme transporter